tara:strand:- start:2121 stop:2834 length:714 start_codon:yes stop_codon:yes gene_type:complete
MLTKNHNLKIIYTITLFFLFCSSSYSSNIQKDLVALENHLNSINNMSFIFEQKNKNNKKEIGWMLVQKPNKLRIEYKGENDLIIIANSSYLVLYKANDDIITSLSNEGPWNILTKKNIKIAINEDNIEANVYLKKIKNFSNNNKNFTTYEILMKNEDNQFNIPLLLYTSSNPFQINGWEIGEKDNKTQVKILKILEFNKKNIDSNIFLLSEKNRNEGKVWLSPFDKKAVIREPKYRD